MIVLQVTEPSWARRIVHIAGDTACIGRNPECDLRLEHEAISKRHAEIVRTEGGYAIRDLGSYNGTYVNERWITETALAEGDVIRVGRFSIAFLTPGEQQAPAVPEERGPVRSARVWLLFILGLGVACIVQAVVLLHVLSGTPPPGPPETEVSSPQPEAAPPEDSPAGEPPPARPVSPDSRAAPPAPAQHAGVPAHAQLPPVLARFRDEIEPMLRERCGTCHDGSSCGRFVLHGGKDVPLRLRLNTLSVLACAEPAEAGVPFLVARASSPQHPGGAALQGPGSEKLSEFIEDPDAARARAGGLPGFWAERPEFLMPALGLSSPLEIFFRRLSLDLLGRPPTEEELREKGRWRPAELVRALVAGKEFRSVWKGGPGQVIREVWGEEPPQAEGAALERLTALCAVKLAGRPDRPKDTGRLAASFLVDLWQRVPAADEKRILSDALSGATPLPGTLPVAAFLLGPVRTPEDPDEWVTRLFVRFLLRTPTDDERREARALLEADGGPRGLVLGIVSSHAYGRY